MARQDRQRLRAELKQGQGTQYAALCYRVRDGKPEILLITSRTTRRWIIPKGWPMSKYGPSKAALQEAWEEAGVDGKVKDKSLGLFSYDKVLDDGSTLPVAVLVYPVKVKSLSKKYPEMGQRLRRWFSPEKAAQRVDEPELARIIRKFDPAKLR